MFCISIYQNIYNSLPHIFKSKGTEKSFRNLIRCFGIDDELINMNDREVLEDLITGAINEVHRKVKELAQEEMTRFTGGIKIPGLFP